MGKLEEIENKIKKLEKDVKELKCFLDDGIKKIDATERVDKEFRDWVEDIQRERLKRLIDDTRKISFSKITSMIPKHNSSKKMKEEIINFKFK